MQTPEEYNQAYSAGYDARHREEGVSEFTDIFGDAASDPKSVPLKDGRGQIVGRAQIDLATGVIFANIRDPEYAKILNGRLGAGLVGISFDTNIPQNNAAEIIKENKNA